jgi:hypothetical protein
MENGKMGYERREWGDIPAFNWHLLNANNHKLG